MAEEAIETIKIVAEEQGQRLDRVLAARIPALSRSRLKALILDGQVTIQAATETRTIRDPATRVNSGDTVTVTLPAPEAPKPAGEPIPLTIVYEDDALIVIDKPKGLVVHPAAGHAKGTLVNALIAHCGDSLSGIGGVKRPGIVHRLDKDTTGLMVVAKTDAAHRALSAQFANKVEGGIERGYLALVWGAPGRPKGTIDAPLDRHPQARDKRAVREGGRQAMTHWQVLERFAGPDGKPIASLLACTEGRTLKPMITASEAVANTTSLSEICPTPFSSTRTAISSVESFCNESLNASTDPSTSPLMITFNSLKLPNARRRPISSSVMCFFARIPCSLNIWARRFAISFASASSSYTLNFSPACGAPFSPRMTAGADGPASSSRLFRSLNMAFTRPKC